jgi:hypothetical protein
MKNRLDMIAKPITNANMINKNTLDDIILSSRFILSVCFVTIVISLLASLKQPTIVMQR